MTIERFAGFRDNQGTGTAGKSKKGESLKESSVDKKTGPKVPRRYPRYAADFRVSIQVFRPEQTLSLWGRSTEMGEDGIGATLTQEMEPGEVVTMEFSLPVTGYPLKLRALVRYRSGLHHGFEFLALSNQQRDMLHRVCEILSTGH